MKKIICLGVLLVMCIGLFFGCGNDLDEYKATKSAELQAYADAKGEYSYSAENWAIIVKAVADGKKAIEISQSESDVNTAFTTAKKMIDQSIKSEISLIITVDKSTVTHGQKITASAVIKNNGEREIEIVSKRLLGWNIPGWNVSDISDISLPIEPKLQILQKGENHMGIEILTVESEQETGVFVLQATATFYLDYQKPEEKKITIKSNKVLIIVQ